MARNINVLFGKQRNPSKKMILGCANLVCVFSDTFEYILKYNKEKGQELPSLVFYAEKLLGI